MTMRATVVNTYQLSLGMFVQSVSGGKSSHTFPSNGVLLETAEQLEALQSMCTLATIDLTRSSDRVYNVWSDKLAPENIENIGLVEEVQPQTIAQPFKEDNEYKQPHYAPETDRYGYQGRLVYRVLEEQLQLLTTGAEINYELFEKQIADFIAYTKINPDLLLLESHMHKSSATLVGVGLRSLVHLAIYGQSYSKNIAFIQPVAMTMLMFTAILARMPKQQSRLYCCEDPVVLAIFANGVTRECRKLEKTYSLPLGIKKTMLHLHERIDGKGPLGVEGIKVVSNAQLINCMFMFELFQSNTLGNRSMSAIDATTSLKRMSGSYFDQNLIERICQVLPMFPTGSMVKIGRHQRALVTQQHPLRKLNPQLLAVTDEQGQNIDKAFWLDIEYQYEGFKQITSVFTHHHEALIRDKIELKMPWYKKILSVQTYKAIFQKIELVS